MRPDGRWRPHARRDRTPVPTRLFTDPPTPAAPPPPVRPPVHRAAASTGAQSSPAAPGAHRPPTWAPWAAAGAVPDARPSSVAGRGGAGRTRSHAHALPPFIVALQSPGAAAASDRRLPARSCGARSAGELPAARHLAEANCCDPRVVQPVNEAARYRAFGWLRARQPSTRDRATPPRATLPTHPSGSEQSGVLPSQGLGRYLWQGIGKGVGEVQGQSRGVKKRLAE